MKTQICATSKGSWNGLVQGRDRIVIGGLIAAI
jgi:hypothetical protein